MQCDVIYEGIFSRCPPPRNPILNHVRLSCLRFIASHGKSCEVSGELDFFWLHKPTQANKSNKFYFLEKKTRIFAISWKIILLALVSLFQENKNSEKIKTPFAVYPPPMGTLPTDHLILENYAEIVWYYAIICENSVMFILTFNFWYQFDRTQTAKLQHQCFVT